MSENLAKLKKFEGKEISRIHSGDTDYTLEIYFKDGTYLKIYAHEWLGAPCLLYQARETEEI